LRGDAGSLARALVASPAPVGCVLAGPRAVGSARSGRVLVATPTPEPARYTLAERAQDAGDLPPDRAELLDQRRLLDRLPSAIRSAGQRGHQRLVDRALPHITVELILRKLGEGATIEELLDAYPRLSANGIHAAMLFAADSIGRQEVFDLTVSETAETAG
jgi:hypothetical protein